MYDKLIKKFLNLVPKEEYNSIMNQDYCEYEHDFYGFLDSYQYIVDNCADIESKTVIDFGCYLASQSYLIPCKEYIGVDVCSLNRFTPPNAKHYYCTIQNYIENHAQNNENNVIAISIAVPDKQAVNLIKENYRNYFTYYPGEGWDISL